MARAVYFEDLDDVAAAATREGAKKSGCGHENWSMTALFKTAAGGASKVVKLKGSNSPDDTVGETLITLTGTSATYFSGSVAGKAYRYIWVSVEAGVDLVLDKVFVWGAGFEGTS